MVIVAAPCGLFLIFVVFYIIGRIGLRRIVGIIVFLFILAMIFGAFN